MKKLSKKIIEELRESFYPDWDASLSADELTNLFERADQIPTGITEYFKIKAEIFRNLGFNAIEQYSRGKKEQADITREVLNDMDKYFLDREEQVK